MVEGIDSRQFVGSHRDRALDDGFYLGISRIDGFDKSSSIFIGFVAYAPVITIDLDAHIGGAVVIAQKTVSKTAASSKNLWMVPIERHAYG